jgi:prevent-host-death family protein
MPTVGVRELRQNLSRYLDQVKRGTSFVVTERGREIARLTPSGPPDSPIARLVADRGATMPSGSLATLGPPRQGSAAGPPSEQLIEQQREERL